MDRCSQSRRASDRDRVAEKFRRLISNSPVNQRGRRLTCLRITAHQAGSRCRAVPNREWKAAHFLEISRSQSIDISQRHDLAIDVKHLRLEKAGAIMATTGFKLEDSRFIKSIFHQGLFGGVALELLRRVLPATPRRLAKVRACNLLKSSIPKPSAAAIGTTTLSEKRFRIITKLSSAPEDPFCWPQSSGPLT